MLRSPPVDWALMRGRNAFLSCLQYGPVPDHIAFIMDGNRRYAREQNLETVEGHHIGFETLANCLSLCYQAGIRCVTVYAFSIENFKRPKHEVEGLMGMAMMKLTQLAQHGDVLDQFGVRMQFLGDMSLVRKDVLEVINRCTELTKNNNAAVLNICAPYTAREEIGSAVRKTVVNYTLPASPPSRRGPFSESRIVRNAKARTLGSVAEEDEDQPKKDYTRNSSVSSSTQVSVFDQEPTNNENTDGTATTPSLSSPPSGSNNHHHHHHGPNLHRRLPDPETITSETLTDNMYTADCPPVDILVRTSGVNRFSDFLLWQCHEKTDLVVVDTLWPAFGFWDFVKIILEWQWKRRTEKSRESGTFVASATAAASGVRAR